MATSAVAAEVASTWSHAAALPAETSHLTLLRTTSVCAKAANDCSYDSTGAPLRVVTVCYRAVLHGQIGNIQMDGLSGQPVNHADAERGKRILVRGLTDEQTQGLLDEGVETFLRRKITCIAGYRRPEQCRHIHRIVSWLRLHQCQLTADIILNTLELFAVVTPSHHIAVGTDGGQSLAVRLVQILLDPFPVYLVGTAVAGKRVHVPRRLLELPQVLRRIVDEEVLVHHMVAGEQYPYRSGK